MTAKTKEQINKEYEILQKRVLGVLPSVQSEIWKKLNIERRKCSKLMIEMEELCLIKRTKKEGSFMVEKVNGEVIEVKSRNFSALLSTSGKLAPCCGCHEMCNPISCIPMDEWIKSDIR